MPAKPYGGYPSRTSYVRVRFSEGLSPIEIAEEMKVGRGFVYNAVLDDEADR